MQIIPKIDDYAWQVRRVPDWTGQTEIMIEIIGAEGCVSFGYSVKEAKRGLKEALLLWIKKYGELALPEGREGAHLIYIEPEMSKEEEDYINVELKKLQ
ncbi:type II toxin-antitoxin system HicB family antitoxin [Alkalihalophilus marmarensis]|uniref:type II toxin-antitoxin system HicB family antitoxin n=1 Tax=Alkalihalophilus marmarensis TaxID=521377 RepID=UPI002DBA420D|nr:type II toxin-antitoxin system HicB family antitoxin [Alkalihalophilus marmarensis]MEC2071798.1 type II toxin-antitoxin system HicB family antitoxin [Alkalihalophilus marmarensis]